MYRVGDLIIYGNTGACRVTEIKMIPAYGEDKDQLYYVLEPLYQDCVITTPVNNNRIFMRPIITKDEAERLIDMIPTIQAEAYHSSVMRELTEHYENIIKTHNCADLIELTMSIYAKKQIVEQQNRKFGSLDEKYMKRAEELLYGELAAALNIPRDSVQDYIASRVSGESNQIL